MTVKKLLFNASSPFPLVDLALHTYSEMQTHSAEVDRWLGLRVCETEASLSTHGCRLRAPERSGEKQELWFGLDPQALLTPYVEIRQLLESLHLKADQTVVDLGSGYGRMGFVLQRHYPDVRFIGYEFVGERVHEARRCYQTHGMNAQAIQHADLSVPSFIPVTADHYFLYDYGTPKAVEKTLYDLKRISRSRPISLIARGRHCRYLIDRSHAWLKKRNPGDSEGRISVYYAEPPHFMTAQP